jgi:sec-independent protein translocase protein TatC
MLTIFNHWYEVRVRLFYIIFSFSLTFFVSYLYSDILMYIYVTPFVDEFEQKKFIFTNLSEAFYSCISLSLNISIICTLFLIIYMIFSFLKAGLYKKEFYLLKNIVCVLMVSLLLSFLFVYFTLLPRIIFFFTQFESSKLFELTLEAKILDYLDLVQNCLFWISIAFQFPVLLFLSIYLKLFSIKSLLNKRKGLIILCFIMGAVFSPPDVFTQVLIALPLCISLELMILFFIVLDEYTLVD